MQDTLCVWSNQWPSSIFHLARVNFLPETTLSFAMKVKGQKSMYNKTTQEITTDVCSFKQSPKLNLYIQYF